MRKARQFIAKRHVTRKTASNMPIGYNSESMLAAFKNNPNLKKCFRVSIEGQTSFGGVAWFLDRAMAREAVKAWETEIAGIYKVRVFKLKPARYAKIGEASYDIQTQSKKQFLEEYNEPSGFEGSFSSTEDMKYLRSLYTGKADKKRR